VNHGERQHSTLATAAIGGDLSFSLFLRGGRASERETERDRGGESEGLSNVVRRAITVSQPGSM